MSGALDSIPVFGSGLGHREEIASSIDEHGDQIDVLEIITERYVERRYEELERLSDRWPVIPHGVSLSVGSVERIDPEHLRRLRDVARITRAPYYSEHLCFTQVPGIDLGHLAPLWFTDAVLQSTIGRVLEIQEELALPLVLENVTYLFEVPDAAMRQAEFFSRLIDATDCGLLLDVTNVYINSVNHGFAPQAFLAELPLGNVVHVHLSGGFWEDGTLVDSHSHPVPEEVWELFSVLCERTPVRTVILEHDAEFPDSFDALLVQIERARAKLHCAGRVADSAGTRTTPSRS